MLTRPQFLVLLFFFFFFSFSLFVVASSSLFEEKGPSSPFPQAFRAFKKLKTNSPPLSSPSNGFNVSYIFSPCIQEPKTVPLYNSDGELPQEVLKALNESDEAIQEYLTDQVPTPGASVLIFYDQEPIFSKGYGVMNLSDPSPQTPDMDSIFRIGSVSKLFVSIALYQIRDAGHLHLDEPVSKYEPRFHLKNSTLPGFQDDEITFRQLTSHLAGLPRETPCDSFYSCNMTNEEAFERIQTLDRILPTDTIAVYSNLGFSSLARILGEIVGMEYEDYVQDYILAPLGMNNTGFLITEDIQEKMAVGYLNNPQGGFSVSPYAYSDIGWNRPAGSMYSTTRDLFKLFSSLFLEEGQQGSSSTQILSSSSVREMFLPQYIANDRETGYASPWELFWLDEHLLRTKGGDISGYEAEVVLVPELKLGMISLTNLMPSASVMTYSLASQLTPAIKTALWHLQPVSNLPSNWQDYVGNYGVGHTVGAQITLSLDYSTLQLQLGSQPNTIYSILPLSASQFMIAQDFANSIDCFGDTTGEAYERVVFGLDENGNVTSFSLPGFAYGRVVQKLSS